MEETKKECCVYLLMDPSKKGIRSIFYVGHGTIERPPMHEKEKKKSKKTEKIKQIKNRGQKVKKVILRHGITKQEAIEIEAAVIELIGKENLTNVQFGHHTKEKGKCDYAAFISEGKIEKNDWEELKREGALLVNIKNSYSIYLTPQKLYKATRGNWKIDVKKISKIKYVVAYYEGVIQEIYEPKSWEQQTKGNDEGRWGFEGCLTRDKIRKKCLNKDISEYISKGRNPIRYLFSSEKHSKQ